ncbi:MAG: lipoate--protein ligase family protein [Nitrospinae bacterium]|nr:lipoate--protein ligase family protein [Nitrospinota bacterium]
MRGDGHPRWRLLNTGPSDGFTNMAVDEAILEACAAGKVSPTLRFYMWSPPALSLGYGQPIEAAIDLARCRALGIDIVRRPTGGRAVLHEHEVTYSVVIREDDPRVASGVLASYLTMSQALMRGFSYLDINAELLPLRRPTSLPADAESPACFTTPSSYEVAVGGRKVVGSAQRRVHGVILQHGSIPLSLDLEKLFSLLRPVKYASAPVTAAAEYRTRMTSLEEAGGRSYPYAEVMEALGRGFSEVWGVELIPGRLTAEERQSCAHLRATKYGSPAWTWRR